MIRRTLFWIKWILLAFMFTLVLVLAVISILVATETGSRWVLGQATQRLPLELGKIEGDLIRGLDISYLEYLPEPESGQSEQRYRVEGLSFRWQPLALLYSTVSVQSLRAEAVLLVLPKGEESDQAQEPITDWPTLALPVRIELGQLEINNIRIQQGATTTELERISGSASLGLVNLSLEKLQVVSADYQVGTSGRIGLRHPYPSDMQVAWRYLLTREEGEPLTLSGQGHLTGDIDIVTLEHQLDAPLVVSSSVRFQPALGEPEQTPRLILENRWRDQSPPRSIWPEDQPRPVTTGELVFDGWLNLYELTLKGKVRAGNLPEVDLDLAGEGDLEQFALADLTLHSLGAKLSTQGQVSWAPLLSWDLQVQARELNPAVYLEDWPGAIDARFSSSGELDRGELSARVRGLQVSGRLRDLALEGSGALAYAKDRFQAEQLQLSLGANRISLNGGAKLSGGAELSNLDLAWSLEAPILSQLDPGLSGGLMAEGRLDGSLVDPRLQLKAQGEALQWQEDYRLEALSVDVQQPAGGQYRLSLSARQLELAEQAIEEIGIEGSGSRDRHSVHTSVVSGDYGRLEWTLVGGYQPLRWEGELTELILAPVNMHSWQLLKPVTLALATDELALGSMCLGPILEFNNDPELVSADSGSVCVQGNWNPDQGSRAQGDIDALPLRLASRWLTQEVALNGILAGQFSFTQPSGQDPEGQLRLETKDAEIRYQYGEGDVDAYHWQAQLDASVEEGEARAALLTNWQDYGQARASVSLIQETGELNGELNAQFDNLAPLEALVPQFQEVGGSLSADLTLAGNMADPQVRGLATLNEGTAKLPMAGVHLQDIGIRVTSEADRLGIEGSVNSGEGTLNLEGELQRLGAADWQAQASLEGQLFQILNTSEFRVLVNPDFSLEANADTIRLEGEATIPKARITLESLPETATGVSGDVVIKQAEAEERRDPGPSLYADLRLKLGTDVHFEGFGLESRLSGGVALLKTPERDLLTTGEVGVAEGTYTAYGQDLTIERGRLIFQGPYDNPGLDIRAVREVEEITAGLEIGGTLQRPRSRVFSNPSMPDSEAMAILFTGKPLSSGSSADASMLINAIGGMGLERSGFITAEIAQTFSLDEFTIQTEDDVSESSLRIGKYITPRLLVRYIVGLFDQTSSIGLRYELTKSLRLEAESGIHQSVDMIYKIER